MSLDERPRSSARPAPREHYNSLPRTSIEGALGTGHCSTTGARCEHTDGTTLRSLRNFSASALSGVSLRCLTMRYKRSPVAQPATSQVTLLPEVLTAVAYLEERAGHRAKKGLAAHSRWAVYRALLDCAKRHGYMHRGHDAAVRISVRRLTLDAGLGKTATRDALAELDASGLIYRVSRGHGTVPGSLALRVPNTDVSGTFVPPPAPSYCTVLVSVRGPLPAPARIGTHRQISGRGAGGGAMSRRESRRACREARQEARLAEPVTEEAGGSWADRALRKVPLPTNGRLAAEAGEGTDADRGKVGGASG